MDTRKQPPQQDLEIESAEFRAYGRKLAEIEWLCVALVLLFTQLSADSGTLSAPLLWALIAFCSFVLIFHYLGLQKRYNQRMLSVDVGMLLVFTTAVIWFTGGLSSPLLNLYFLVVGTAAIMLPRGATFGVAGLISLCCLGLAYDSRILATPDWSRLGRPLITLFALWLVAYLIAILSGEKESARKKVHLLSRTDDLTGLWNMRMFAQMAEQEHNRSKRYHRTFAIAMVDADNLKPVNDQYGHQAGGEFIRHLASCLQQNLRQTDSVARYGGDEFVLLLPETNAEEASQALERVREAVAR
ncbi:MAG: GGDEF domain-containing protein, partial [Acidobacteriota bacterium]